MSGSSPDKAAQWKEARRWFAIASEDLRVARLYMDADPPSRDAAAYHCQQAAEKLIKGLLVGVAAPFRKIHDLDELASQAVGSYPSLAADLNFCRPLTRWGTLFRYPAVDDEAELRPSGAEISEAVDRLTSIERVIRDLDPEKS